MMEDNLDEAYLLILEADEFVKNFETMEEFRDWCDEGELVDLYPVLDIFEEYELYEHCAVIKDIIDKKND